jgi:hypothetical protein
MGVPIPPRRASGTDRTSTYLGASQRVERTADKYAIIKLVEV